jgi:hypothetical protein
MLRLYELRVPESPYYYRTGLLALQLRFSVAAAKGKRRRRVRPKMHATAAARLYPSGFLEPPMVMVFLGVPRPHIGWIRPVIRSGEAIEII